MEVFVPSKIIIFVLSGMPSIASSKVSKFCYSGKRGPGNETLKKRKERTAFYNRFQPSAGPGNEFCMQFHFHANQSHFHKNGLALRLALKQRHRGTRKWPIRLTVH